MTENYLYIANLIYRERMNLISEEERQKLEAWLEEDADHRKVFDEIAGEADWQHLPEIYRSVDHRKNWRQLEKKLVRPVHSIRKWIGYAASVCLLVGAAWMGVKLSAEKETLPLAQKQHETFKAILHMQDGKQVALTGENAVIAADSAMGRIEQVKRTLVYKAKNPVMYAHKNTLEVPNGGEFNLVLADGTKVWLNAGTKLTYPVVFFGEERRVKLKGEAYFEVTKDETHPFVVEMKKMEVQVLGTSFNLRAFGEEERTVATLVTGKIRVKTEKDTLVLRPDQQAVLAHEGDLLELKEVDAETYRAWTHGKFVFRRERLEMIMADISRWYNVPVFYEQSSVKEMEFSGIMARYGDLRETLNMLEKTDKVMFDINPERIIVKAK